MSQAQSGLTAAKDALTAKQADRAKLLREHERSQQQLRSAEAERDKAQQEAAAAATEEDAATVVRRVAQPNPTARDPSAVDAVTLSQAMKKVQGQLVELDQRIAATKRARRTATSKRGAAKRAASSSARAVSAAEARVEALQGKLKVRGSTSCYRCVMAGGDGWKLCCCCRTQKASATYYRNSSYNSRWSRALQGNCLRQTFSSACRTSAKNTALSEKRWYRNASKNCKRQTSPSNRCNLRRRQPPNVAGALNRVNS